jgi:hypothetical protein
MPLCEWNPEAVAPATIDPETGERTGCTNQASLLCAPWMDGPRFILCASCAEAPRFVAMVQRDPLPEEEPS